MASIPEESLEKLLYFRREMDRIFREFFDPSREEVLTEGGNVELPLDVFETEGEIIIEAELPGLSREDLELSVLFIAIVLIGGAGTISGTLMGTVFVVMSPKFVEEASTV